MRENFHVRFGKRPCTRATCRPTFMEGDRGPQKLTPLASASQDPNSRILKQCIGGGGQRNPLGVGGPYKTPISTMTMQLGGRRPRVPPK